MNETFWLGLGTPGSTAPAESLPQSPGPEWRNKWSTHDPAKANQMLDALGLNKKDRDGYRLRTDNGERLRLQVQTVRAFLPWPQQMEMVAQHWRRIGIFAEVREMERVLAFTRTQNNEHHIHVWTNGGTELLYLFPRHAIPVDPTEAFMGPEFAKWYASGGRLGREPTDPGLKKILEMFRSAAGQKDDERNKTAQEIWKILVDQQYSIGTVGQSPGPDGRAAREPQARQHPVARLHRAALPHARQLAAGDVVLSVVMQFDCFAAKWSHAGGGLPPPLWGRVGEGVPRVRTSV